MKRTCFLMIGLLMAAMGFAQVQIQKGVSYRYNGKNPRTPLPNVTIKCDAATNAVKSDSKTGEFSITFPKLKMGDPIGHVKVEKREMMVFNQHAVDEWSIRKEPLCLILCDADEFERQKREYMDLGRRDAKRKYDRQKVELEKQLNEGKIKLEDMENALNIAYEMLEKLQKEIEKYADDLARIDLSELDDKMQEILDMYQHGESEEAIEKLKSLKLAEEFDKETAHNEAMQQELQKSDSKLYALVEQMKSSVALLKNSGEWEEAGKYLKRIADKLNTYDDVSAYADFCNGQNNHDDAIVYYNRALLLIDEDTYKDSWFYQKDSWYYHYKRVSILEGLGTMYYYTHRLKECETAFTEALETCRRFIPSYRLAFDVYLASTLNDLACLYKNTQRYKESETMFLEALEFSRCQAQSDPQTYEPNVAMVLTNLGSLYEDAQRFTESEAMHLEALEIFRRMAQSNPQAYESQVISVLTSLGTLYKDTQRVSESEAMYIEALEISRRQAQSNPQAYEPDVARILYNLGELYYNNQRLMESKTMFSEAMEIYRRMAQFSPKAYETSLAFTLKCLGTLYQDLEQYEDSETMYQEATEILRRLVKNNPQLNGTVLVDILNKMGLLYMGKGQYNTAISYYEESLDICRKWEFYKLSGNENILNLPLYMLGSLYDIIKDHTRCYEVNEEWISILKEHYQKDANTYQGLYLNALGNQSFQCIFVKQFEKSGQYAREALAIDSTLHWINTNLAAALLFQGKYDEAEAIYLQYKDELKDRFLQDLQDFEAAGVIPKKRKADVERIRKILSE